MTDQISVTDEKLKAALHSLRVEFAEWQLREFPLFGFDAIRQMGMRGLCSQDEANAAISAAQDRLYSEEAMQAATEQSEAIPLDELELKYWR